MANHCSRAELFRRSAVLAALGVVRTLPTSLLGGARVLAMGSAGGFLAGIEAEEALGLAPVVLGAAAVTTVALMTDAEDEDAVTGVYE